MLDLLLLRHAKSAWDDPALGDRERPLNKRGRQAAGLMGDYLRENSLRPDLALVSAAVRTQETWKRMRKRWSDPLPKVEVLEDLYLASASNILALIRQAPAGTRRLLILAHSPGIEKLARRMAGPGSEAAAASALADKYPTAGLAWLQFDTEDWSQIGEGRLLRFVVPKDLAEEVGGD